MCGWPINLRVVHWRDFHDVVHIFRQSRNHPYDWNPRCDGSTRGFGASSSFDVLMEVRKAASADVPATCVVCLAKFTE